MMELSPMGERAREEHMMEYSDLLVQVNHSEYVFHLYHNTRGCPCGMADNPPATIEINIELIEKAAKSGYRLCNTCEKLIEKNNHPSKIGYVTADVLVDALGMEK